MAVEWETVGSLDKSGLSEAAWECMAEHAVAHQDVRRQGHTLDTTPALLTRYIDLNKGKDTDPL